MRGRSLSELECFVLGLIWEKGPCSAYDIRRQMLDSPSTQWSASAGSIYPLVRKLERLGLVTARGERTGRRPRRVYRVTAAGERGARVWIGPPLSREAVTVTHDPLRSRARFLRLLTPAARTAWVDAALATLDEVERRVKRWNERNRGRGTPAALMTRTGELDLRARRQWLRELRRDVKGGASPGRVGYFEAAPPPGTSPKPGGRNTPKRSGTTLTRR